MIRPLQNYQFLCLICVLWLVVACSPKKVSREQAAELIRANETFLKGETYDITIGHLLYDWRNMDLEYEPLEAAGIVTIKAHPGSYVIWWKLYDIELTSNGRELAKSWTLTEERKKSEFGVDTHEIVYTAPTAQRELIGVTGVASNAENKQAQVEFSWKWTPTPTGKRLQKAIEATPQDGTALLTLYDDGWRVSEISLF
jgi:hypothetical protein